MGAGSGGGDGEGGGQERGKEDARRGVGGWGAVLFSSRHLRALVPTALTAGRLGCPSGSQLAEAWDGATHPAATTEGERPPRPRRGGGPAASSGVSFCSEWERDVGGLGGIGQATLR